MPAANHRGRVWEPFEGSHESSRVGSPPAVPAANHRGRVWEPFEGSHVIAWGARRLPRRYWIWNGVVPLWAGSKVVTALSPLRALMRTI